MADLCLGFYRKELLRLFYQEINFWRSIPIHLQNKDELKTYRYKPAAPLSNYGAIQR